MRERDERWFGAWHGHAVSASFRTGIRESVGRGSSDVHRLKTSGSDSLLRGVGKAGLVGDAATDTAQAGRHAQAVKWGFELAEQRVIRG
jgi:hypothetical protein